jgi:signal transduction histidine kinase
MRERAELIGATLEIHNADAGPGAEVRLEVPVEVPA